MPTNPYSVADISAKPQNELEASALIHTASRLNTLRENWPPKMQDLNDALEMNRKLWTIFATDVCEESNPLPREIKQNIFNLAHFIFKHTFAVQTKPTAHGLEVLININMNVAKGLNEQTHPAETEQKTAGGSTDT